MPTANIFATYRPFCGLQIHVRGKTVNDQVSECGFKYGLPEYNYSYTFTESSLP